jgi:tRNA(fMet)-specific endonuclease VapC
VKVLDTDTCIGLLRGRADLLSRRAGEPSEVVVTTWVTGCELFFGAERSSNPAGNAASVLRFLSTLKVLSLDAASAQLFGEVKARLRARGNVVADADLMIAAIALARGATVVTGNRRHFSRVPGLEIEDWLRPNKPDPA